MSYYILPTKHFVIPLIPAVQDDPLQKEVPIPYISYSVSHYLNEVNAELSQCDISSVNIDILQKQINPYDFLINSDFTNTTNTIKYFIFIELFKITNLFDKPYLNEANNYIRCLCDDENRNDIIKSIQFINKYKKVVDIKTDLNKDQNIDLLFFLSIRTSNINTYVEDCILVLCEILLYQSTEGNCIIKLDEIIYKPIIDIIYLLSIIYNKIYIIKPYASSSFKNERFIVCKNQSISSIERQKLLEFINSYCKNKIYTENSSIILNEIPIHFLNKIEESNLGIAHKILEYNDILINIIHNNLCKEKHENLKKNSIHKCIIWCDKYKFPYNCLMDTNIFSTNTTAILKQTKPLII